MKLGKRVIDTLFKSIINWN